MNDHPASWLMPIPKQMEKLANSLLRTPGIDDPPPAGALPQQYWEELLPDPRAAGRPSLPIQQMRLSEIPRELLRVEWWNAPDALAASRSSASMPFGSTGRTRPGERSVSACSTVAAGSGRAVSRRTDAGRTEFDDPRSALVVCCIQGARPWQRTMKRQQHDILPAIYPLS
jgi:hypothetical protein